MSNTQPQWKDLPDSPGIWVLQREDDLAALLGAKYAILQIKQCSLDRPTSRKYCVRAYGPIPTETAAAQIIRPEPPQEIQPMPQFSPHDLQQLQIDQLIRDVKELNQRSIRSDLAYSAAFTQEKEARKLLETQHKEQISLLRKEIDDCNTNRIANVEDLQSQIQAENAIVEQLTEKLNDIDRNELEHADSLRELIKIVGENLQKQIEQEKQTRIANDRAQVEFTAKHSTRLDMHAKDLAELTADAKEADKKILANAGAIARVIRELEHPTTANTFAQKLSDRFENLHKIICDQSERIEKLENWKDYFRIVNEVTPDGPAGMNHEEEMRAIGEELKLRNTACELPTTEDDPLRQEDPKIEEIRNITDPTATAWNTNPEGILRKLKDDIYSVLNRLPTA